MLRPVLQSLDTRHRKGLTIGLRESNLPEESSVPKITQNAAIDLRGSTRDFDDHKPHGSKA
jgi:hypothetical protein